MMSEENSILSKTQEEKLSSYFDEKVRRAEAPAPKLIDYDNAEAFTKANDQYHDNPLLSKIQEIKAEVDSQASGATEDQRRELYQSRIAKLKTKFISGMREGAPDPDAESKQQGVISSLLSGDWIGAIKHFVMSIPIVGDFIAGTLRFAKSKFPGGEGLTFSQAQERSTLDRSLSGATANMGLESEEARRFIRGGIAAYEDPNFKPAAAEPAPQVEVASEQKAKEAAKEAVQGAPATPDPNFDRANGDLPEGASKPVTPAAPPAVAAASPAP